MISFRRVCLRHSLAQALAITRHSTRKDDRENIFFRKISFEIRKLEQSLVSRNKIFQSENSLRKFLSVSHSLSFFGFGLFGKHNSAHAVMTSSRLHFTLDKTALTCLHSHTQAHAHCIRLLQSESHALSPSAWTSVQRRQEVHLRAVCALCAEYTHAQ